MLKDYEIWSLDVDNTRDGHCDARRRESFYTSDELQAMKCYVRDNLASTFYYANWKESHSIYILGDLIFVVLDLATTTDHKNLVLKTIYNTFIKKKRQTSACDCGARAVKTTHSHWCSSLEA